MLLNLTLCLLRNYRVKNKTLKGKNGLGGNLKNSLSRVYLSFYLVPLNIIEYPTIQNWKRRKHDFFALTNLNSEPKVFFILLFGKYWWLVKWHLGSGPLSIYNRISSTLSASKLAWKTPLKSDFGNVWTGCFWIGFKWRIEKSKITIFSVFLNYFLKFVFNIVLKLNCHC